MKCGEKTPKEYKNLNSKTKKWTQDTISRILSDKFYTGKMVLNKSRSNIKTKKIKRVPKDLWEYIDNTHEPIISKEQYDKVELIRKNRYKKPTRKYEYLLRDLVYCGYCNSKMQYKNRARTKVHNKKIENPEITWYYKCRMIYRFPEICDRGHTIKETTLNQIVRESLKSRFKKIKIDKATNKIISGYKSISVIYKLQEKYNNLKQKIGNSIKTLYNNRVEEKITIEEFKSQYDVLKIQEKEVNLKLEEINKEINNKITAQRLVEIINDFKNSKDFTNEIMKELIEKIKIFEDNKVEIIFKF